MHSDRMHHGLSKSKLTSFEQCPRKLWLSVHRPDAAVPDPGAEGRFAAGHAVGDLACAQLQGGVMIEAVPDLDAALERTARLMAESPVPMFEATFSHDGVLVRVDVMEPDGSGGWHVAEVKASSDPKDYHWADLATQLWVMQEAGIAVSSAAIRHLDRDFRLIVEDAYDGLFMDSIAGSDIDALIKRRPSVVEAARATLAGPEPDLAPGSHCTKPFTCEFGAWCGRDLPAGPEWPIELLPNTGSRLAARWAEAGVYELLDLPAESLSNPTHRRIQQATMTGVPFHDPEGARRATDDWAWPRIYLDFETIQHAIPRWIGSGPYQQTPFQFSAHVEKRDGTLSHTGFLSTDGDDPRAGIAEALSALPGEGAVVAYNAGFERRCLRDLAVAVPDHAQALLSLAARLVDLLPVARAHWYHRDQRGSWSIKYVLPTVAPELDYAQLDVKDGGLAMEAWREAVDPATSVARHAEIRAALNAYCARDTEAMVVLLKRLRG